jgi:hypothetical protein
VVLWCLERAHSPCVSTARWAVRGRRFRVPCSDIAAGRKRSGLGAAEDAGFGRRVRVCIQRCAYQSRASLIAVVVSSTCCPASQLTGLCNSTLVSPGCTPRACEIRNAHTVQHINETSVQTMQWEGMHFVSRGHVPAASTCGSTACRAAPPRRSQ